MFRYALKIKTDNSRIPTNIHKRPTRNDVLYDCM